jgi:hypothetical protein
MNTKIACDRVITHETYNGITKVIKLSDDEYLWLALKKDGDKHVLDYSKMFEKKKTKDMMSFFKGLGNLTSDEIFELFDKELKTN